MRAKKVTIAKIIGNTPKSIENWEKEGRKILELIYKYFTEEDLQEFIETGKVSRLEKNNTNITDEDLMLFFADNGIFKITQMLKWDEEIQMIIDWINKSQTVDEFIETAKRHDFLSIVLNSLEINALLKNKKYSIKKIKILKGVRA